jgi:small subunit ribosomal protein S14
MIRRIHKKNIKDLKLRKKYLKVELKCKFLKIFLQNRFLNKKIRSKIFLKRKKIKISIVKICNRCVITGRRKGIIRSFKISRIIFKSLVTKGLLIGVKKIS